MSETFELCKQVHERTGWQPTDYFDGEYVITQEDADAGGYDDGQLLPLYTSDYLLEKLPSSLNDDEDDTYRLTVHKVNGDWLANYVYDNVGMWHRYGSTPLLSLLKLTIALSEAGELNGDEQL